MSEFSRLAVLKTLPRHVSWLAVRPRTDRLHQVRRHLKHLSHPVLGDANYGKGALNREFRERYGLERMALHARSLRFEHPESGDEMVIFALSPKICPRH